MSERGKSSQETPAVDEAMNRVLAAEQEARQAVDACRHEAAALVAAAEERAVRIARNAERRIKAAHRIADEAVERALAGLAGTHAASAGAMPVAMDEAALDRAIAALGDEIIGGVR